MKLEITLKEGRWLVNGKRFQDLSKPEAKALNNFFIAAKTTKDA